MKDICTEIAKAESCMIFRAESACEKQRSGLLAVMSMACVVAMRTRKEVSSDLSAKYGRLWVAAEVMLFVFVGAAVDIRYTLQAGGWALVLILVALVLSVAVLSILVTAPLGAIGMDLSYRKLLNRSRQN